MTPSPRSRQEMERFDAVGALYRERYRYTFAAEFQAERNRFIMELLAGAPDMTVLDLGCGSGIMLEELCRTFHRVAGIDISMEMLAAVDRASLGERCALLLLKGDMEALPFREGAFDRVVCRSILHHSEAEAAVLKALFRVLRPGGRLVIAEPMNDNPFFRLARWFMRRSRSYGKLHAIDRAFRAPALRRMVRAAGFEVEREVRYGFVAYPLCDNTDLVPLLKGCPFRTHVARLLRALDRGLAHLPGIRMLSWYGLMSAKKPGEETQRDS